MPASVFGSAWRDGREVLVSPGMMAEPVSKPKRQRKPITDPELLERRRAALAKARAARAEKLAAAGSEGARQASNG
jgi:hypothetical protein